jgi:ectoine hydroxylase-related dioxygenase (phytanoyl-CoA dioxygenase family)
MEPACFLEHGFAVIEGFLDDAEVREVRVAVAERALAADEENSCRRPNNTLISLRWNDPIVGAVLGRQRRLAGLSEVVGATDLRWISGYVSTKEARSEALWWHQDWWCWDHPASYRRATPQIAVLCYLVDTTARKGALRLLPGTHLRSHPLHALLPEAHGDSTAGLPADHPAMKDQVGQRTLSVRAGDATVLDYRLLHGAHANTTDERRDCLLLSFTPSWRYLPADIRAHLIQHPAQPDDLERSQAIAAGRVLPSYAGRRKNLALNRFPPPDFQVDD